MRRAWMLFASFVSITGVGCVTGRRTTPLDIPQPSGLVAPSKPPLGVGPVTDQRRFENKPSDPSTPSINGDVSEVSREQLKVLVGRQRNSFGKAMGDIALPGGQTVESQVQQLVELGFRRRGYAIGSRGQTPDAAVVTINEFWAWTTPGFSSLSFEARVRCTISATVGGKNRSFDVLGYGINKGQVASDANWQLAYKLAFDDFLAKFDTAAAAAGL